MNLSKLDHYNIETTRAQETIYFYTKILGLANRPDRRPPCDDPGTWFFLDNQAVVHVNFVAKKISGKTGAVNHIAFEGHGYQAYCRHFRNHEVPFKVVESPHQNLAQIFVTDPNGVRIEMNFNDELPVGE